MEDRATYRVHDNYEQNLIASILRDPHRVMCEISTAGIDEHKFEDEECGKLFAIAASILKSGGKPDRYSMSTKLSELKQDNSILSKYSTEISTANSLYYAERVVRSWKQRRLRYLSLILADAVEADNEPDDLITSAQQEIVEISTVKGNDVKTLKSTRAEKIEQWRAAKGKGYIGIPSFSKSLNKQIGGYRPGVMTVLGGYRGEGKSTLSRQEALFTAKESGIPVGLITPEDPADVCAAGIVGNIFDFSTYYCDTGDTKMDLDSIESQWAGVEDLPIYMIDQPQTISDIELNITMLKTRYNIGMAIIDHLQYILSSGHRFESRNIEISNYTRRIAATARRLNIPILVLSQLSRDAERKDRKPRLSDLRDSGAIEQDARVALLLYRDCEEGCHILEVAKNNQGPSGACIKFKRCDGFQRFEEVKEYDYQNTKQDVRAALECPY